jgi:hypothetical protein
MFKTNKIRFLSSLVFKCCYLSIFLNLGITLFGNLAFGLDVSKKSQSLSKEGNFILCGQACDRSEFFIGYNRTNTVQLGQKTVALPRAKDQILLNTSDLRAKLPNNDVQSLDNRGGNFVNSIHRIENLRIGFAEKSELLQVHGLNANASAEATVKLIWGDTLTINSKTLKTGTPIKIIITRTIGGFGNPVTENAYYEAIAKTYINKNEILDLTYSGAKKAGVGETDQILGKDKISYVIETKVGEKLTIESSLKVLDGVKGSSTSNQTLNGADSVSYQIKLADEFITLACLKSTSKIFDSGKC